MSHAQSRTSVEFADGLTREADRGLLHRGWFQGLAIGSIMLALLMWTRYHRASL